MYANSYIDPSAYLVSGHPDRGFLSICGVIWWL